MSGHGATGIIAAYPIPLAEAPDDTFVGVARPDDTVQVIPMWFDVDGETLRCTHTAYRAPSTATCTTTRR